MPAKASSNQSAKQFHLTQMNLAQAVPHSPSPLQTNSPDELAEVSIELFNGNEWEQVAGKLLGNYLLT